MTDKSSDSGVGGGDGWQGRDGLKHNELCSSVRDVILTRIRASKLAKM